MPNGSNTASSDGSGDIYRKYFEGLPCYVTVQDADLRIVDTNELFQNRFGNGVGTPCWEAYKGRSTRCRVCAVQQTFEQGEGQQGEELIRDSSGLEFPVFVYTSPIRSATGAIDRVLKISADISGVKKLQKRLHKTHQQYQQLFQEVPCYVSVQNRDLKITQSNRRFQEDFGLDEDIYCYEAYKHREEPCLNCPVVRTFDDGRSHRSEEVVTSLGGEHYNVLVQTAPLRNDAGEITHVVEMSTNITEVRQLQDQLTSLGLLVGSISHNLKGLITSLDGGMYLVNSGLKKKNNQRVEEGWDIVQRNFARIRAMVLDILNCAKEREIELRPLDVSQFASEVYSLLEVKSDALEIEFERNIDPNIGEAPLDANAMRSALVAILENSFDACRVDLRKQSHRVSFDARLDGEDVLFTVQDNGIGMDRETREKMFSLFFSSKGTEGTGLGLYIANRIVQKHGGSIEVSSTQDVGTSFNIRLPSRQDA
ncbi:MAG: ATP-binding protein [bacterium]